MKLTAERGDEVIVLGEDFDFQTAYEYVVERDTDPDNPWLDGYEIILDDIGIRWLLVADCWEEIEEEE